MRCSAAALALALAACSAPASTPGDAEVALDSGRAPDAALPSRTCPARFQESPGGACEPVLPAGACAAGTMPVLGQPACQVVGWSGCPQGFQPDPSRWGCAPVLPPTSCAGATRAALGASACQPIGDCGAPFPPPEATLFVDDSYPPQALDARHFATLAAALAAAPAGAVIAVEAGRYEESLAPARSVTLVGRCPAQTVLAGPAGSTAPGLSVAGAALAVTVSGLALQGHEMGATVLDGATLVLRDCELSENRTLGLLVGYAGSAAVLERVAIRGTLPRSDGEAGRGLAIEQGGSATLNDCTLVSNSEDGASAKDPGSELDLVRTAILGTLPSPGGDSFGVYVQDGARARITDSAVVDHGVAAVTLFGAGTRAEIDGLVATGTGRRGLNAQDGASATVSHAWLEAGSECALAVVAGASVEASDCVLRGTAAAEGGGAKLDEGASLALHRCAVLGTRSVGLSLGDEQDALTLDRVLVADMAAPAGEAAVAIIALAGRLTADALALQRSVVYALVVWNGAKADLTALLVEDTLPGGGSAVLVGSEELIGANLTLRSAVVRRSAEVALAAGGQGCAVLAEGLLVSDTAARAGDRAYGHGILTYDRAVLDLRSSEVRSSAGAALVFDDASGVVRESLVAGNAVGVRAQHGSFLVELPEARAPFAHEVVFDEATAFVGNGTRVGEGTVPLPSLPFAASAPDAGVPSAGDAGTALPDEERASWPLPPESPADYAVDADTVTDRVTGLVWQRAATTQSYDQAAAGAYCQGLSAGGRTGWQLPTVVELLSIVDSSRAKPCLNDAFTGTAAWFWSSTPCAGRAGYGWDVSFSMGNPGYHGSTTTNLVRCVLRTPRPAGRFAVGADTVSDTATGLVWQRAVVAQSFDWAAAQSACQSLSLGGFSSGWRLPAKKELEALVDRRVAFPGPTIDAAAFPGTPAESFWTATPVTGWPGYAWSLGFDDGATGGGKGAQNTARIRCVH
jgi:hypothetical protein